MKAISGEVDRNLSYSFEPTSIEGPEKISGNLNIESNVLPEIIDTKDIVEIIGSDQNDRRIRVQLRQDAAAQNSILIRHDKQYHYLPLLSAPSFYIVHSLINGNTNQAVSVLEEYYDKRGTWAFRSDCRDSLCFRAFANVLNQLAGGYTNAKHVQFRSALGYFAKRILDQGPQEIKSFEVLQQRVEYWNSCEYLKQTDVAEVVAERLGRNSYRGGISTEREDLERINYDPIEFDSEWKTVAPAAWLSHLLITQGIIQAEEFAKQRPKSRNQDYETLKDQAFDAGYESRASKWGQVLPVSSAADDGDLRYDIFQYLRWTAEDCRTKGKFVPLLYRGALIALPQNMSAEQEQRLRARQYISIGHNWRRDSASKKEIKSFERAKSIARGASGPGYSFCSNVFVDAEASLIHAFAKSIDSRDRRKGTYQVGLRKINRLQNEGVISEDLAPKKIEFLQDELNSL